MVDQRRNGQIDPGDVLSGEAVFALQREAPVQDAMRCAAGGEGFMRISLIADCDRLQVALNRMKQANIRFDMTNELAPVSRS